MGPKTITLSRPIEVKGKQSGEVLETIGTLTPREPVADDLFAALDQATGNDGKLGTGTLLKVLAARCCGITTAQLAELPLGDTMKVIEAVKDFLPDGLLTGPTALG